MVNPKKTLGEFEITVLAAVLHLGTDAYGASIIAEIQSRTGRDVSLGALHATLSRLETKGLLQSRFGDATPIRGGRAKKFVRLTEAGFSNFESSMQDLQNMLQGLPSRAGAVLA